MLNVDDNNTPDREKLRALPSIDRLLAGFDDAVSTYGHDVVTDALRAVIDDRRARILAGQSPSTDEESVREAARRILAAGESARLQRVFNLTGTVLHTNLGRATLPSEAIDAIRSVASGPSNLEFDLGSGKRGDRETYVEALVCELTGAEAATVVNNNAAAVLLVLNTLAINREVPVSRGELVEIGGSFRIPEVMQRANCILVEVGATNRTHLKDFQNAIGEQTALLMKVHTSNYRIEGFTKEVRDSELAELAHKHDLPFVVDLGSGCLVDFSQYGLPKEPTVSEVLARGPDLVTFSGDKLLGGPQCGIIAGRADLVAKIRSNPLKRALRLDKMTLAGLAEVLKLYRRPDELVSALPTLRLLSRSAEDISAQAERIAPRLREMLGARFSVVVTNADSQVGSGALPVQTIPSAAIAISAADGEDDSRRLLAAFRGLPVPVIGYAHKGRLLLDLRCLDDEDGFLSQLEALRL